MMHPRNKHRHGYDFEQLGKHCPELVPFVALNKYGNESINFSDPNAVKALNKALLMRHYAIERWDLPKQYLCPGIPNRADYLHYLADLLGNQKEATIPKGPAVRILDVGIGANCVYPIIGRQEYDWSFVGSEVDPQALRAANAIVQFNPNLKNKVECRLQKDKAYIFKDIIREGEVFHATMCNPPFHSSKAEAQKTNQQKNRKLKLKGRQVALNFGGKSSELVYEGGEFTFVKKMIQESVLYAKNVQWFTTLVSKKANLHNLYEILKNVKAKNVKTIEMAQGQKQSRFIAWRF